MDKQYNLSNLEASFRQYLLAVNGKTLNSVTIKNYLSDFRHFYGWMVKEGKVQSATLRLRSGQEFKVEEIQNIDPQTIESYVQYQKQGGTPIKTINRRLSTLRKFGGFCISQGWMKENPFKKISNVQIQNPNQIQNSNELIITKYEEYLVKQNLDRQNINNLIADTKEFYQLTQPNL